MTQEQWNTGWMRSLAVMLNGQTLGQVDQMGDPITDDTFLVMLNSFGDRVTYTLPQSPRSRGWKLLMNTYDLEDPFGEKMLDGVLDVAGRSIVILRELKADEAHPFQTEQAENRQADSEPATEPLEVAEPVLEEA